MQIYRKAEIMITIDSAALDSLLISLTERVGNLLPAYQNIGEYMQLRTRDRFDAESGPAGAKWKPLNPRYKAYKARKGLDTGINKRTRLLRDTTTYQADRAQLLFGSPQDYAGYVEGDRPWLEMDARDRFEVGEILYEYLDR
jgi:phage gpG-like protein